MARAKGISKAQGYITRVFTAEYDLHGMIEAYGREFIVWLMDEIIAGRVNCKQDVDRWAAHVRLTQDMAFAKYSADYGQAAQEQRERDEAAAKLLTKENAKRAARGLKLVKPDRAAA